MALQTAEMLGIILQIVKVIQIVKKFPACYGTWRFITVFTKAYHWSLSSARL